MIGAIINKTIEIGVAVFCKYIPTLCPIRFFMKYNPMIPFKMPLVMILDVRIKNGSTPILNNANAIIRSSKKLMLINI